VEVFWLRKKTKYIVALEQARVRSKADWLKGKNLKVMNG
jgi:hypothetical protein